MVPECPHPAAAVVDDTKAADFSSRPIQALLHQPIVSNRPTAALC